MTARHLTALVLLALPWGLLVLTLAAWPELVPGSLDQVMNAWAAVIRPLLASGPVLAVQLMVPYWAPLLIASSGFAVAWHRYLLLEGRLKRGFIVSWAIHAGLVLGFLVVALLGIGGLALAVEHLPESIRQHAGAGVIALGVAATLILAARLSPVTVAATLGDQTTGLKKAWRATRRRSGMLGLGLLLVIVPVAGALFGLMGARDVLTPWGAAVVRTLVWMLGLGLIGTYVSLIYARVTGRVID